MKTETNKPPATESRGEHTPGDWATELWHDDAHPSIDRIIFQKTTLRMIAYIPTDILESSHSEANARLIAAAPELLVALNEALKFSDWRGILLQRSADESSWADRVSDLITATEGQP